MAANLCACFSTDRLLQQVQRRLEKAKLWHNQTKIVLTRSGIQVYIENRQEQTN